MREKVGCSAAVSPTVSIADDDTQSVRLCPQRKSVIQVLFFVFCFLFCFVTSQAGSCLTDSSRHRLAEMNAMTTPLLLYFLPVNRLTVGASGSVLQCP